MSRGLGDVYKRQIVLKFGAFTLKFFGIFLAVGGYTLIWGWRFAVGVVLLILAHELGHYIEARRAGLNPQLPVFVPFLGAYVALRNMRFDPWVNARVSLAGPVYGGQASQRGDAAEEHERREQLPEQRRTAAVVLAREGLGLGRGDRFERAVAIGLRPICVPRTPPTTAPRGRIP